MGLLKSGTPPELDKLEIDSERYPGLLLNVRWLSPERMDEINDEATVTKRRRGVEVKEVDRKLVNRLMVRSMVLGWEGFKADYVRKMMPLDAESFESIKRLPGGCLPFSQDDLDTLSRCSYSSDFLDTVIAVCTDLEKINKVKEEQARKNSSGSQPTAETPSGPVPASSATA